MLENKKIVVGVTGSIAAYKSAMLVRLLVKAGAQVRVVMTSDAHAFITPLTLSTLSREPVWTDFVRDESGQWNNHVELGLWGDALVIAPATANTIAKMAHGLCDNLLMAVYLSARCPVFVAPAMDLDMLQHPSTTKNIEALRSYGNRIIDPGYGDLASGLTGTGRMAEPEEIVGELSSFFRRSQRLSGKRALVTAGPTREAIDPVRFISNHSSGKMGYAVAEALAAAGAEVVLVSGPTEQRIHHPLVKVVPVVTAREMLEASEREFENTDIVVLSAAVADYRPTHTATQKIKKSGESQTLSLTRTDDIAATLGKRKRNGQVVVGFALETDNEESNALAKLRAKNFDLIVLNSLRDEGAGFGYDTNKITLFDGEKKSTFPLQSKKQVAYDIVDAIIERNHA